MKAIIGQGYGPPETFTWMSAPSPPPPGPDEVQVAIAYAGVSFADTLIAAGQYQLRPDLPMIPGGEFSGHVIAAGDQVPGLRPGTKVVGATLCGAFAETLNVAARNLIALSPDHDLQLAVAAYMPQSTALHAYDRAGLGEDDDVLVLGAGGTVGMAAIQVARQIGARVIAAASTPQKREAAKMLGAHATISSDPQTLRKELTQATADGRIDVVFDTVGGALTEVAFRSLRPEGRHLMVGFASGTIAALPTNLPLLKEAALIGINIGAWHERRPAWHNPVGERLTNYWRKGVLKPIIRDVFPLREFAAAMRAVASRDHVGRIIIAV